MLKVVVGLAALPLVGLAAQRAAEARDRRLLPMPGRLVEVDGVQLHVVVEGAGPVVLIDSGLGGSSIEWAAVAGELRSVATVVRYDRPAFGWSPAADVDRSPVAAAERMRGLLQALRLSGPVVLVGHSLGGLHVRVLASLHPSLVAGLVLVDPSHEDMLDAAPVPASAAVMERVMGWLAAAAPFGIARVGGRLYSKAVVGQLRRPVDEETRRSVRASTLLTSCSVAGLRAAVAELRALPASLKQARGVLHVATVPVTVIGASAPARTDAERRGREVIDRLHAELAAASPRGRHVLATESGHLVPLDQPSLIATCVRETLDAATTGSWESA